MGRLVFAVPGSPLDPRAAGTNGLIKAGATMVTEVADVSDALDPLAEPAPSPAATLFEGDAAEPAHDDEAPPSDRERVVTALGPTPVEVDDLVAHCGVAPGTVQTVLLELDLAGRLERHRGGFVSLV